MAAIRFISHLEASGYGLAGIAYVRGLVNAGVPVQWVPLLREGRTVRPWRHGSDPLPPAVDGSRGRDAALADIHALLAATVAPVAHDTVVIHAVPEYLSQFLEPGRRNVAYTTWETDRLPSHWLPLLRQMQAILVPCRFNAEVFVRSGVTAPVHVVPHIRRHEWNPFTPEEVAARRQALQIPADHFVFYSIADWWGGRKNIEGMLAAYTRAFSRDDPVSLVLKTSEVASAGRPLFERVPALERMQQLLAAFAAGKGAPLPHIALIASNQVMGRDIDLLHETGDAYVSLSRGEGWGLGAFDAASRGTPVLMPNWGGVTDFLGDDWLGAIPYRLTAADVWPIDEPSFHSSQRWADADIPAAAALMQRAVAEPAAFRAAAAAQAESIANRFAEGVVTRRLLSGLYAAD